MKWIKRKFQQSKVFWKETNWNFRTTKYNKWNFEKFQNGFLKDSWADGDDKGRVNELIDRSIEITQFVHQGKKKEIVRKWTVSQGYVSQYQKI